MFKKSKSDSKSYGIIGLGRFGSALAVELAKSGAEPLVIDGNEEKVREMREYTENAFVVSSFDKKTLSETGIQNCDVVVVCIGEKMDTSILPREGYGSQTRPQTGNSQYAGLCSAEPKAESP